MAKVSQFAAPRDGEASFWFAYDNIPLGPPGAPNVATVWESAAPRDGEASFWFASDATALGLPGAPERGVSLKVRGPQ